MPRVPLPLSIALSLAAAVLAAPAAAQPAPTIHVFPASGTVQGSTLNATVGWWYPRGGTRTITATGPNGPVTVSFTDGPEMRDPETQELVYVSSSGQVPLATGTTKLIATICPPNQACLADTAQYVVPPPANHAPPVIGLGAHSNWMAAEIAGSTLSYSTPAYVSLDQPRSLTLHYVSDHADPRALVQVDVTDPSTIPASAFSIRVLNASNVAQTLSNGQTTAYYGNAGGTTGGVSRLAAQFSTSALATGGHRFTVEVTSHWSGVTHTSTAQVVVLVVNRASSRFGAGWTLAGLKALHADGLGVMVDEADGSARYFRKDGALYIPPPGDPSQLTYDAGTQRYHRTWPDGSGETYNAAGQLLFAHALPADTVKYTYGGSGDRVASVTDAAGLVTSFQYHTGSPERLASITTPGGRATQLAYLNGNLTGVQEPGGSTALSATYDTQKRLSWWTDHTGGRWDASYDHTGALASLTAPSITVAGQAARPATQVVAARRALLPQSGQGTSSAPLARVLPANVATTVTSPRNGVTTTRTDRFGLPLSVVGPLGHTTTIERDSVGRPRVIHSSRGTQTIVSHDGDGDVDGSFDQGRGLQSTVEYGTFSGAKLVTRTVSGGRETRYVRGSRGELLALVVQGDTVVWHTYDSRYRVKTTRYRDGQVVTAFYDGTTWRNADSVRVAASGTTRTTAYTFDAFGRVRTVRDPSGRVRTDSLDLLGRLLKQRAPGDSVRFAYDSVGLWRVTDAVGKVFEFRRNRLGWVEQEVDPNGRITSMAYDAEGNVVSMTDRVGRTYGATFDLLGRPLTRTAPGLTNTTYKYDNPYDTYFVVDNGEARDSVHYAQSGQMASVTSTMGGVRYLIEAEYNSFGQRWNTALSAVPAGGGSTLWSESRSYLYDSRQRLSSLTRDGVGSTTLTYDGAHRLSQVTYPGTTGTATLAYTPRSQLQSVTYSRSNVHAAFGLGFQTYDALDRRLTRTWENGWRQRTHAYDGPGRMTSYADERWSLQQPWYPWCTGEPWLPECLPTYDWGPVGSGSYAYDAVGNRTSWMVTDSVGTTGYASASLQTTSNRYASFDGWTMQYDTVGNLVRRVKGGLEYLYQWNSLGQLTGVRNPAYTWVYYGYNGLGMRVRRTQGGVDRRFLYDGAELAAEVTGAGARLRTYAHFPGIDVPHSVRQWESGQNGAVHFYALELPGNNVQGLFNASGTITHSYRYSPWGEEQAVSEGSPNPLRFASREWDATTGLYYNRARWYDPYLGRFISEDPIGIDGGINVYAYGGNDPVNVTDPMGLTCLGQDYRTTTCGLAGITVTARPRGWWYTSMIDMTGGLRDLWGGGTSIMSGMVAMPFHDDGSIPDLEPGPDSSGDSPTWRQCFGESMDAAASLAVGAIAAGGAALKEVGEDVIRRADGRLNDLLRNGGRALSVNDPAGRAMTRQGGRLVTRLAVGGALVAGGKYAVVGAGGLLLGYAGGAGVMCAIEPRSYR